ncbi:MAG: cupin domain-containing protein [Gaiellales bacterium]
MESGRRSFDEPDERSELAAGRVVAEKLTLGGVVAHRVTHAPGWRWSVHSSPEVGEPRCPKTHVGLVTAGRLWVEPADGEGFEATSGDLVVILPGHDAWTVGDHPAVLVEIER